MATILTNNFKYKNAQEIMKLFHDVTEFENHNVYLFIGRSRAWSDENSPDAPSTLVSQQEEFDVYNDIIVLKKITASDVSIVAPKYVWNDASANVAFTTWEHNSSTIFERDGTSPNAQPFYVATQEDSDDWSIWKCLMNVSGGSPTTKPAIGDMGVTHLKGDGSGDGYVWKYMYSVSNAKMVKFSSAVADSSGKLWMPVETLYAAPSTAENISTSSQWDVQRQAVHGGVHLIKPTTAIGLMDINKLIRLDGDGTGFEGTIRSVTISGTTYYYVNITDPGNDYTFVRRVMKQTLAGGSSSFPRDYTADSNLTAILSPIGGHGWDSVKELGGHRIMIHTTLEGDRSFGQQGGDYQHLYGGPAGTTHTDYRTIGLIVDPIQSSSGRDNITNDAQGDFIQTGQRQSAVDATNLVRLQYIYETRDEELIPAITDWREKEIMQVNGTSTSDTFIAVGRVVDINTDSKHLYVIPYTGKWRSPTSYTRFEADPGSYVFLNESGTLNSDNFFRIKEVKANDLIPYSGDIIYLDNQEKIARDVTKTETIRIVIEF